MVLSIDEQVTYNITTATHRLVEAAWLNYIVLLIR